MSGRLDSMALITLGDAPSYGLGTASSFAVGVGGVKDGFHVLLRLLGLPAHHGDLLPILNGEVRGHATLTVLGRETSTPFSKYGCEQIPSSLEEVLGVVVIRGTGEQLDIERAGGAIL